MRTIQLYNSLTNSMETFFPLDPPNVRMYVCGPTVYASPHLGNARPIVVFDVLFRLLREVYGANHVTFARNITDVDDKINKRATDLGISIRELTDEVITQFHATISQLNVLPITHEPRATDHIPEILKIIQILIENEFAYEASGHVLFRVQKMAEYGLLSKRKTDEMIAGSRVEVAPYKEDPMDFVLWKPSKSGEPAWDSPYSSGRPGWHIECSAMSSKYLGEQFDIHAGGHDLMFPHHENEIAQSFGAFGCIMARYWLHNGMLLINGQKMSKSLGNIITLDNALKEYDGEVIRYILLSSHYQKTLNWNDQAIHQAKSGLNRLYGALKKGEEALNTDAKDALQLNDNESQYDESASTVLDALCSNLNTPLALSELLKVADEIYANEAHEAQDTVNKLVKKLKKEANFLGLLKKDAKQWFKGDSNPISDTEIERMILERSEAKNIKDYKKADDIRSKLLEMGVKIEDGKSGTEWKWIR